MAFKRNTQLYGMGYGASNVAYLPTFQFPYYNFWGTGIVPQFHWQIVQPEQLWVNPALRVIGNPGIQNAQMIGQPQLDTRGIVGI